MEGMMGRDIDRVDQYGQFGWSDRVGEGFTRGILLQLREGGRLDRDALIREMTARGHDSSAIDRLIRLIDESSREPERQLWS